MMNENCTLTVHKVDLVKYNPDWAEQAAIAIKAIQSSLGKHCLEVHHFGSTSVAGLCSKNKIDLICVVDRLENSLALEKIGYEFRGEWNIPLRYGFAKRNPGFKANVHVTEPDHGFIQLNLSFRDYLRANAKARDDYAKLKQTIVKDPKMHLKPAKNTLPNYNLAKDRFINAVIKASGYQGYHVNFSTHQREWQAYQRILEKNEIDPAISECSKNHACIDDDNHYHFILYYGADIVSCSQIEKLNATEFALKALAAEPSDQMELHKSRLLTFIEKWLAHHGYKWSKFLHSDNC